MHLNSNRMTQQAGTTIESARTYFATVELSIIDTHLYSRDVAWARHTCIWLQNGQQLVLWPSSIDCDSVESLNLVPRILHNRGEPCRCIVLSIRRIQQLRDDRERVVHFGTLLELCHRKK